MSDVYSLFTSGGMFGFALAMIVYWIGLAFGGALILIRKAL